MACADLEVDEIADTVVGAQDNLEGIEDTVPVHLPAEDVAVEDKSRVQEARLVAS